MQSNIFQAVVNHTGVTHDLIMRMEERASVVTMARSITWYFLSRKLGWTDYKIAQYFGLDPTQHATTVKRQVKKVEDWQIALDFRQQIEAIEKELTP